MEGWNLDGRAGIGLQGGRLRRQERDRAQVRMVFEDQS